MRPSKLGPPRRWIVFFLPHPRNPPPTSSQSPLDPKPHPSPHPTPCALHPHRLDCEPGRAGGSRLHRGTRAAAWAWSPRRDPLRRPPGADVLHALELLASGASFEGAFESCSNLLRWRFRTGAGWKCMLATGGLIVIFSDAKKRSFGALASAIQTRLEMCRLPRPTTPPRRAAASRCIAS